MYGPQWGPPPYPYFMPPPQREPTFEDKLRELEHLDNYRKKLKEEIKHSDKPKEEKAMKKLEKMHPITVFLFMMATWPLWSVIMINLNAAALHALNK